jgi:hypothetical protein
MSGKGLLLRLALPIAILTHAGYSFSQSETKASGAEKFEMSIDTSSNMISYDKIRYQNTYSMDEREGRGIVTTFLITKGIQGIQSMIHNRKKKYNSDYSFAIKDESFYDQVSADGPFDPVGIRFKGFTITRIFNHDDQPADTAFLASFAIDTSGDKMSEIMNNGIFRLKLDTFILKSGRVKLPKHLKNLNMDMEISFLSSYISNNGQINTDVKVGSFVYSIRNAPLDQNDPSYKEYYQNLPKKSPFCTGQSFLIPRSAGYFKNDKSKKVEQCWGEGLFSIKVAVKESSKNTFVDKLIIYNSGDLLTVGNASLIKKYGTKPTVPTKVIIVKGAK